MNDILRARELLRDPAVTCAFVRGEEKWVRKERGVAPLVSLVGAGKRLDGFSAADRIVGRAAALLYALLGVREVYAEVLAEGAIPILDAHKIAYGCAKRVPSIVNRAGTGLCPMERATEGISDPEEGYRAILKALSALSAGGGSASPAAPA